MLRSIPFIYNAKEAALVRQYYQDADVIRVGLDSLDKVGALPPKSGVWVDGAVDGLDVSPTANPVGKWETYIRKFPGWDKVADATFHEKPTKGVVDGFVRAILDACFKAHPKALWLSVPQLPAATGNGRNKINKALADATAGWRSKARFHGKLILPVILRRQEQANLKTNRTRKIDLAAQCYERAGADGYWVVESSLSDQKGEGTFEKKRFPGLVRFHEEIAARMPKEAISIAGPYWGMNLVLWARGLVSHPAIGVGGRYQYHVPGGPGKPPKIRVALAPLRRWAIWSPKLQQWLGQAPKDDPALNELRDLLKDFSRFGTEEQARAQIAEFYRGWLGTLESVAPSGRSFALYQDLSSAYVLGKGLPNLPDDEKTARRPERVAEQLMLQCL